MDKIQRLLLIMKYSNDINKLNFLKEAKPTYKFLIDLMPIITHTNLNNELSKISYSKKKIKNKKILLINLDPTDLNYNNFLRNCFIEFFNNNNITNDLISYENLHDLESNLSSFFISNENIYGDTYFFSSIFTDKIFELIINLIKNNTYEKIIFHGRGYFIYKLLISDFFENIKNKLIIYSSHLLDFNSDLRGIKNLDEKKFNKKINSILKYFHAKNEFYTFPKYLFEKILINNSSKDKTKFKIFFGGKSNRDVDKIKYFINKLNLISGDFEFFITSNYDFSECKNCIVYKYLQFKDFMEILKNCDLNIILNKDLTKNSGDTTLMLGYFYGVPGITNTIDKYSLQYIKDNHTGFLINDNNFDEVIDKISIIKDNYNIRKELSENTKKFFLDNFTTEKLVEKIYNNL